MRHARGLALAVLVAVPWWLRLATPADPTGMRTGDLRTYFYPSYEAFFGALARGVWLGWNPYQACGLPWLGTLQTGFFYPPHVLYLVLPTHAALFASQLLHVVLAALGTAALLARLGVAPAAAATGAILFACYGPFAAWLAWPYLLEATAWLPLGCLAVHELATVPDGRATARLASALGMSWLAGGPQGTVFLLYAWGSLFVVLVAAHGRRTWRRGVASMAVAVALGTLAGMAALLPARELAAESVRATSTLESARMFPAGLGATSIWSVVAVGGIAGFPALAWALAPLAPIVRGRRALALWCAGAIAFTALVTTGPTYPWAFELYRTLPFLGWFRAPGRILLLAGFSCALLTAMGADVLVALARRASGAAPIVGIGLITLAIAGITSLPGALPYDAEAAAGYRVHDGAYERLARLQGDRRVWLASDQAPSATPPRLATVHAVRSVLDYEPVMLRRQREYFDALFGVAGPREWLRTLPEFLGGMRLLDLMAARYVVVPSARTAGVVGGLTSAGMRVVDAGDDALTVLENPHALPRAYVAYRTAPAPPALLDVLRHPNFDPTSLTYVDGGPVVGGPEAPSGHAATITVDEPQRVELEADLSAPGVVVLADTFARGWTATVDGRAVPIVPANHLFRAVEMPAGHHVVRFAYRPPGLLAGLALSLAAWVAIAVLGKRPRGARHRSPEAHEGSPRHG